MTSELFSAIYNKALDILSRREHSVFELKQKLKKKYDIEDDIEETISRLKKNNLLNDYRFSESYVVYRKRKGFGPVKISKELESKGVAEVIIFEVLDKHSALDGPIRLLYGTDNTNGLLKQLKPKKKPVKWLTVKKNFYS